MTNQNIAFNLKSFALALVASAATLSFTAVPARAASETIAFQSSELASTGGRAAVEARVEAAAERVCAVGGVDMRSLVEAQNYKDCVTSAVAEAKSAVAQTRTATMVASR